MQSLDAVVAQQVACVRARNPHRAAEINSVTRLLPQLLSELGVRQFLGPILTDAKPRLLLRFQVDPVGPLGGLGPSIVLKLYGDRPRGEGPLLAHWRSRGVNTPRVLFGERDGCSWLALEHLTLTALEPHGPTGVLALTKEVARWAAVMHAPAPRLTSLLRELDVVMLPRWEAAVAALRSSGHEVPSSWRSRAEWAYSAGESSPLHGDLGLTNVARDQDGKLVVYDASAFLGPRTFDGVRWAARLSDEAVSPDEVLEQWTEVEGAAPAGPLAAEMLAVECLLEAGSLEIVRERLKHRDAAQALRLRSSADRLVAFARGKLGR